MAEKQPAPASAQVPVARPLPGLRPKSGWRAYLGLWAVVWAPLFLWWLALYPGAMSPDSLSSWRQIVTGNWTSHHPVPYTAAMWVTSGAGTSPATTSLAQTVLMAAALAYLAGSLSWWFDAAWAPWAGAVALGVLPLVGPFSVTLWKDVPETAALLVLAGLLLRATGREAMPRSWWALLVATALAVALLRWNGVAAVIVAAVVAAAGLARRLRWQVPVAMACAGLVGFGVLLGIPKVFPVAPLSTLDRDAAQLADLAQFARNTPKAFRPQDVAVLERVAPFALWRVAGHNCYSRDPVYYNLILHRHQEAAVAANASALSGVWGRVASREPGELIRARVCRASLAWNLLDPPGGPLLTIAAQITPNPYGFTLSGPSWLRRPAVSWAGVSEHRRTQELAWRPALWLLLLVGAYAIARPRGRGWRVLALLLAVPLGVVASYAADPAAQDARYTYGAVVICQLTVLACLAGRLRRRRRPDRAAEGDGVREQRGQAVGA